MKTKVGARARLVAWVGTCPLMIALVCAPHARAEDGARGDDAGAPREASRASLESNPRPVLADPGRADPRDTEAEERARKHFSRGVSLYRDGAFGGAAVEFERAYAVKPNPAVIYNIAQTALQLHDYVSARATFERYLHLGGASIDAERRAQVEAALEELRGRIGYLVVRASVDGAEVVIDDREAGRTPLSAPIPVNVGRHRLEVRTDGGRAAVRTIEIAGGEEITETFELAAPPRPSPATMEEGLPHERTWLRPFRVAGVLTTSALLGAALTAGYFAKQAERALRAELDKRPGDASDIDAARERTKLMTRMSDGFGAAAAVVGISTVVLLLMRRHPERQAVRLGLSGDRVSFHGRF